VSEQAGRADLAAEGSEGFQEAAETRAAVLNNGSCMLYLHLRHSGQKYDRRKGKNIGAG
jgi:hypothetical protein